MYCQKWGFVTSSKLCQVRPKLTYQNTPKNSRMEIFNFFVHMYCQKWGFVTSSKLCQVRPKLTYQNTPKNSRMEILIFFVHMYEEFSFYFRWISPCSARESGPSAQTRSLRGSNKNKYLAPNSKYHISSKNYGSQC